jgi:uncharacterized metal-binding protein YceD (DUF177 family)
MTPEFSRPERLDTVGEAPRAVTIEATDTERAAVARRFGLVAIDRLAAQLTLRREAAGIVATGMVEADVVQACSVTGDPLPARVAEEVALRFVEPGDAADEIELSGDLMDTIEIEGGTIDLGEAAAETLALALDPFPRSPRAADVLREAGVVAEDEIAHGPFAALKKLKEQ